MAYVLKMQEDGQQPLPKDEWRKTRLPQDSDTIGDWMTKERERMQEK